MTKFAVAMVWAELDGELFPTVEFVEANSPKEAADAAFLVYEPNPKADWDVEKWDARQFEEERDCFVIDEVRVFLTVKEIK